MKNALYSLSAVFLFMLIFAPGLRAQPTCVEANGLNWCYNDEACGEACNDVCAALGLVPEDNQVWFEAQDTEAECQVISEALGLGNTVRYSALFRRHAPRITEPKWTRSGLRAVQTRGAPYARARTRRPRFSACPPNRPPAPRARTRLSRPTPRATAILFRGLW